MKSKLATMIIVVVCLFTVGINARAQGQSIDEQIKQKEAELQRLKEIKLRQEKIQQLQDEVNRLQAGQDLTPGAGSPTQPAPTPATHPPTGPPPTQPPGATAPVTKSLVTPTTGTDPNLPTLRSCADVAKLS